MLQSLLQGLAKVEGLGLPFCSLEAPYKDYKAINFIMIQASTESYPGPTLLRTRSVLGWANPEKHALLMNCSTQKKDVILP